MDLNPYGVPIHPEPKRGQWIQGRSPNDESRVCFFTIEDDGERKFGIGKAKDALSHSVLAWMPVDFPKPFQE